MPPAFRILNLGNAGPVGPSQSFWRGEGNVITGNINSYRNFNEQSPNFTTDAPGYFGFRFAFGDNENEYYYGWASMTIDLSARDSGFKITEAFYESTANTPINVGAVPAVPERSSLALLAAGAAGVAAWRARKKPPVVAA